MTATTAALDHVDFRPNGPAQAAGGRIKSAFPAGLAIDIVMDMAGLEALEPEWNDLFGRTGRPGQVFQSFNWSWHWCRHYLTDRRTRLAIVVGRQDGRLVMLWPLVVEERTGLRTLAWLGAPLGQYGDVLLDAGLGNRSIWLDAGWQTLVDEVRPDVLRLRKVRSDSDAAWFLTELGATVTDRQVAPFADIGSAPTYDAYQARYSSADRKNRRRKRKRLSELGTVAFRRLPPGPEAAGRAAAVIEQKRAWLRERGLVSEAFADRRIDAFFQDVTAGGERPVETCLCELTLDGQPIASAIGFPAKGSLALHVSTYESAHERVGPGNVLLEDMMRHCKEQGLTTFDMLAPGARYKDEWADGAVEVCDYVVVTGLSGSLFRSVYLDWLRPRLKRLVNGRAGSLRAGPPALLKLMGLC